MDYNPLYAHELLRLGVGDTRAEFREHQSEAIGHIVENKGRLLVVQNTGWGKSFVYFIATRILRDSGSGPALLISPLLALMRNQIAAAKRMGINAATINSNNMDDWASVIESIHRNEVDILLISPERLTNAEFVSMVMAHIAQSISLLVIDEAHCISDWGHDFRPKYRSIERIMRSLPRNMRLLATTATANNRVMADLQAVLGPELRVMRGDLSRPSLFLQTIRMPSQVDRLAWMAQQVPGMPGSGIIYVLTKRDAHLVADWLKSHGLNVEAYTGGDQPSDDDASRRERLEQALLDNKLDALVATPALGMGFDKPDLSFVIHYQTPGSVVTYYQQVGRAGRALDSAYGILLSGEEEQEINDFFIESAFPSQNEVRLIIEALEHEPDGLSVPEMCARLNISMGRISKTVDLLSLESPAPIAKTGTRWQLTTTNLHPSFWERAERLTSLRRDEQLQMQQYVDLKDGHMAFLINALDGDIRALTQPDIPPLPVSVDAQLQLQAAAFLRRTSLPITPRKKWPNWGMPQYGLKGNIPPNQHAQTGRALCYWGDAGWGEAVRLGKYSLGHFGEELVAASAESVREWVVQPALAWVTSIPSLRHPVLVPDFARRLAAALNLPYHEVLHRTEQRPEQKSMANSIQQARNVDGSLAVLPEKLPRGAVLLVDDMVDSQWTFTVASWLLRTHGSGEVFPFALAKTGHGD